MNPPLDHPLGYYASTVLAILNNDATRLGQFLEWIKGQTYSEEDGIAIYYPVDVLRFKIGCH